MSLQDLSDGDLIAAHRAAKRKVAVLSRLIPLVVVLLVGFYVWSIAEQVRAVDPERFSEVLEQRASSLWPRIEDKLSEVATNLEPVIRAEIDKQSTAAAPKIERRVEAEVEAMKVKVERDFGSELEKALAEIESRQRNSLVAEMPVLKGDPKAQDRVLESVRIGLLKWCMKQLTDTLHEHMLAMERIRNTLQRSYRQEGGSDVRPEDAIFTWLDLMNEAVGGDETILGGTPEDEALQKEAGGDSAPTKKVIKTGGVEE